MADIDAPFARILAAYTAAVHARDVDAFMRLYDPKVRVFDTWGLWSYEGADAWRVAVEGWFTSLGSNERVKVSFEDVQTSGGSDHAAVTAIVRYAAVSATGEPLRSMHNRITWVLRTSGHVLRIVHEHTSAPVDFDHMKAILERAGH
jgi:ketosteroid isomerase-like protein